ncbi:uncharacterized protein Z518_10002 [Rhinocladiella mackenziei CBS 650.93]|uniref:Uncharacterized protein n=1 Tax=Rhinocladiella mackenziei CBS 650.93 TaxID=1442369 RepID=A0A0D2FG13_9EURO|nr:uncharacterized protein Z518_10002 [Rhinocladiella mackenziei CBS 650.93]KIX00937.1 hypothetical protein Z518_10002 [Rhinocladiella mackenziei CBS 650.93]
MSTNPFRRSSLKGPGGSSTPHIPSADPRGTSPGPLSVDTRAPSTTQKHVNFASPPAIPISPVSYPPSPESTRQEFLTAFSGPKSSDPLPIDYSQALASDPFAGEASDGEDDGAIGEALKNAKANAVIATLAKPSPENAVKDTLGRFASSTRRPSSHQLGVGAKDQSGSTKPAMDVDAFKRMLLTGERGPSSTSSPRDGVVQNTQAGPSQSVSESSSSADTASISQHSIFETAPPMQEESPRTSDDLGANETDEQRAGLGTAPEGKKKPPPPKSRRGKPLKEIGVEQGPTATFDNFIHSLSLPDSSNVGSETPPLRSSPIGQRSPGDSLAASTALDSQKRTPPAPPLARRKSQQAPSKPVLTRSSSSRYSVLSGYDAPPSPSTNSTSKPPPPPPSRRSNSTGDRGPSFDALSVPENTCLASKQSPTESPGSDSGPGLPSTSSYLKRMSQGPPPPVPPPRRGRGSSRSSVETQRPPMAALGMSEPGGSDPNVGRSGTDARDILADLAALQKEVDAARAGAGGL